MPTLGDYGRPSLSAILINNLRILYRLWVGGRGAPVPLPPDTTVVVLDVIEPYASLWRDANRRALRRVLGVARARGLPVVFSRWVRTRCYPLDPVAKKRHWTYAIPESALDADGKSRLLYPDLVHSGDTVVDATATNILAHESVQLPPGAPILLCGMWTESCVLNSARAAIEDGRPVFVYAPACAGHWGIGWYALWTIEALYGDVIFELETTKHKPT